MARAQGGGWEMLIGAPVYTADGRRLGYVLGTHADQLRVSEGYLFRCKYVIEFGEIARFDEDALVLACTMEKLRQDGQGT